MIDSVYQNYTLMNTHVLYNRVLNNKSCQSQVNLGNDEIKHVLDMLVASYFLNKVTCTRNILET